MKNNLFRFKQKHFFLFFSFSLISLCVSAQKTHTFTEGLHVEIPQNYGREALYTDELLWQLYSNKLATPSVGKTLELSLSQNKWIKATADSTGFFRPQRGSGGNLQQPNNPPGPGRIAEQNTNPRPAQQYRGPRPSYLYLTYNSSKEQTAILNVKGNSAVVVNGALHSGDPYRMGWMDIPVHLKKGLNEFYVRGAYISASLTFPQHPVQFSTQDLTLPDIVQGKDNSNLIVGIVLLNNSTQNLSDLQIQSITNGQKVISALPVINGNSSRKVVVRIDGSAIQKTGDITSQLSLLKNGKVIGNTPIQLRSVDLKTAYRVTFVSNIDNSVQYYAVNPATGGEKPQDALFFSVHGAGVEALGQAQAYQAKDWGTLVAPTNRRPRGFNWEDWGRLDALEVLSLAKAQLQPDTQRVYLTGHSMGGHGTWFLGATYPDKWAAIAPCAGYPTLKGYGSADGLVPEKGRNALEEVLLRSGNQSDVIAYATNYKPLGVYILHGDADRTVSVDYARQMRNILGGFHPDFSYYEYPGGSHWYSNESVDWKPLFDYFKWHKRKTHNEVDHIDFMTANPGISASYYWATVYQQLNPLDYSRILLDRDMVKRSIVGQTTNVQTLRLDLRGFNKTEQVSITLDSLNTIEHHITDSKSSFVYLKKEGTSWKVINEPSLAHKGPHRNGTFKEAFNNRMVYVYGTQGTKEENNWAMEKANYDAEAWYYRGNGAFDIIADRDFEETKYAGRNIILIGNAKTNSAWNILLKDCPVKVETGKVNIGEKSYSGDDLGGYFYWKKPGSDVLSVGVITGNGIAGMRAATANQYFAGASGFPDYMFFKLAMLKDGVEGIVDAGFYSNEWNVKSN
ncbi:prolyl oligopeptidase family serine peptidase [Sphingobacterium spiritivorum]|uniref:carboxylesterase family protein n=1 Tax=Sphingobacterium spiritivorum TaxID=258 RepID=UPI001918EBF0|nr:PHB depolymerase family esterase [Sphingobacterium spiritivorum]QQT27819.1 prolyl oligopeptidase family serine peptidase [Sphingobacterium spiritivorum]